MRLPLLNSISTRKKMIGTFGGLNENEVINENEFSDMKNMSSRFYPVAGTREPRGKVVKTLIKPNGLYFKDGLVYVDGINLYYKDTVIGTVSDCEKQMVGLGAYIAIFPDKILYNTKTLELKSMEQTWNQSSSAIIEPVNTGSAFTKISCVGIGKQFEKLDAVEISGCTVSGFNKTTVIQDKMDDYIVIIGIVDVRTTQTTGMSVKRTVPDMDYITQFENRIWGCSSKNHEIYACKLGDPFNWNAFEGISTDSYAVTVGTDGDFTGAITHLGYVLFFKEDTIHKVYGNKPSNIQITAMPLRGVAKGCEKSLCIVNETLYYASRNGICSYDGSMPYLISEVISKTDYKSASAGQYGNKYYISLEQSNGWQVYVYSPDLKMWHKEDDTQFKTATYGAGLLYYVDQTNNLRTIAEKSGKEQIEWYIESGDLLESELNKKKIHKLQLMLELEVGTYLEVFIKRDQEAAWNRLSVVHAAQKQVYTIMLNPCRCTHYRYKLQGLGGFKLMGIGKVIESGSDR